MSFSFLFSGQVFFQNLLNGNDQLSTLEGPQQDDMSYLGYSMAMGHFSENTFEDVAVGMPRGNFFTGQVVLMNHRLKGLLNITGDQVNKNEN